MDLIRQIQKDLLEDVGNRGAGIDQLGRDAQRLRRSVRVAEPACVHGHGGQNTSGHVRAEGDFQVPDRFKNQSAGGFDRCIDQKLAGQVGVAADVVVDHQPGALELAHPVAKSAQLAPA